MRRGEDCFPVRASAYKGGKGRKAGSLFLPRLLKSLHGIPPSAAIVYHSLPRKALVCDEEGRGTTRIWRRASADFPLGRAADNAPREGRKATPRKGATRRRRRGTSSPKTLRPPVLPPGRQARARCLTRELLAFSRGRGRGLPRLPRRFLP